MTNENKVELEFNKLSEECREFVEELNELRAEIKVGKGIKLDADKLEEIYGL